MTEIFKNILTIIGQQKKATAEAGGAPVNITHFKVGDGNGFYYEPLETQTSLLRSVYTGVFGAGSQSQKIVNPTAANEVLYKCYIPADVGGFTIRELGLFDANNDLILICKIPAQEKFALEAGIYQPLTLTPKIIYTNPQSQAVLSVASQIIATQTFVTENITAVIDGHTTDPNAHKEKFETIEDEVNAHIADKSVHGQHLPLFALLTMPKLLIGEESIGWGLQGSSHTRAVYETAYDVLAEALSNGTSTTDTILISNINNANVTKTVNCKLYNGIRVVNIANIAQVNDLYTTCGSQPYFVVDTTNHIFTLPKNENAVRFTTDTSKGGLYNKDQIVNITGTEPLDGRNYLGNGLPTGVFCQSSITMDTATSGSARVMAVDFNASKVVNTGVEVQVRNVNHFLYYKIGNTIANEALVDIGNLLSEIDLKVDKDFANIPLVNILAILGLQSTVEGVIKIPQRISNGTVRNYIIQYGTIPYTYHCATATITFPITFPNAKVCQVFNFGGSNNTVQWYTTVSSLSGFSAFIQWAGGGNPSVQYNWWLAIGY